MPSQVQLQPSMSSPDVSTISILTARQQYQTCHIQVPDVPQCLPAICVRGRYYSYFKVTRDQQQALRVAEKLSRRQETATITKIPKGYAVWVLEPNAQQNCLKACTPANSFNAAPNVIPNAGLEPPGQPLYPACEIRVPDLDESLSAIAIEGDYYSLFQVAKDQEEMRRITAILERRGDKTAITQTNGQYNIWVWEPEATLAVSS